MPKTSSIAPPSADDLERVRTETVVDPETYGRLLKLGRTATYRALKAGEPVKPIVAGKLYRIPTPPLRKLLHLEPPAAA